MKTTLLLTVVVMMIPTLASAQVDVIVTNAGMLPQTVTLSDQNVAQVSYWEVGRVKLTDFENYSFTVIKNGNYLDDITHKNTAIFYNGDYIIKVYNRQTKELISTVSFTSEIKITTGQQMLLGLSFLVLVILIVMTRWKVQDELLIRRRGWRHA
jgi:hypothetical protein